MNPANDFDRDLERMDRDLAEVEAKFQGGPPDLDVAVRMAGRRYHRAALTGDPGDVARAEEALRAARVLFGDAADLCLIQANVDFMLHRLPAVRRALAASPELAASPQGRAIRGDLCFQCGEYREARGLYEDAIAEDPSWDNLARLAHFESQLGSAEQADELYAQAEDDLTAKQMRAYAWVQIQRGLLDRARGRYDEAMAHYRRADQGYSGYWKVAEHVAEIVGAEGRWLEAAAAYEDIVARVRRPELYQALAELHACAGDAARSETWAARALDGYLSAAAAGGVHYYHHLVDFYADVRHDGPRAVEWARKDLALRRNFHTQLALAWALHRARRFDEAATAADDALASGVRDARSFSQAASIFEAAGSTGKAQRYAALARQMNPRLDSFHVHR